MPREHGDKGEFVETTTLDDVRSVFEEVDGPVVLSADVSDQLGCTRETARRKLETLHERGDLHRRKVARRVIYWQPTPSSTRSDHARGTEQLEDSEIGTSDESVEAALDGWSHGRNEAEREASQRIARSATEWLRDRAAPARKNEVPLDEFAADDPVDRTPDTLWTEVIKSAWTHASERGMITKPSLRKYEWVGTDQ